MPIISFVSPKGGAGKTTSAVILACQLAESGAEVVIIDADPNRPVSDWGKKSEGKLPQTLRIEADVNEHNVVDKIIEAAEAVPFVIVDCEGTADLSVAYAVGQSDLVMIPTQGSALDAKQAARAIQLVRNQSKHTRREIPHAAVLTRTGAAVKSRELRFVSEDFSAAGVQILKTEVNERAAFKSMFSFGGTLSTLDPSQVSNIDKAVENANAFADEVIGILRQHQSAAVQETA